MECLFKRFNRFILRNKIKWAKQILDFKNKRTQGGVMPTSAHDRFNQTYEDLYFFVKSKKYYSDLDAVRLPNQVLGVTDMRASGFVRSAELYYNSKYRNENYSPQNKQSGVRNKYGKGSKFEQKYGEPWDRFGKNTKKAKIQKNRVDDPRDNSEDGLGSWGENLDNQEYRKRWKGQKEVGVPATYIGPTGEDHNLLNNPAGKNLPSVWLIQSEPHNFSSELGVDSDHFATFPQALVEIPIKFGCPEFVCKKCGMAREKVFERQNDSNWEFRKKRGATGGSVEQGSKQQIGSGWSHDLPVVENKLIGYTDCGCGVGYDKGIVLDCFMGSGTTALVARSLGRDYIGIELNKEYIEIAEKRLAQQILI